MQIKNKEKLRTITQVSFKMWLTLNNELIFIFFDQLNKTSSNNLIHFTALPRGIEGLVILRDNEISNYDLD